MEEDRDARRDVRSLAQLERDAALDRVGRTRRWVIIATAALTAAFAAVVSAVAPGRTLAAHRQPGTATVAATAARTPAPNVTSGRMPPLASPSSLGLQGPSQAPQPAPEQAPAPAPPQPSPDPSQSASAPDPSQSTPAQPGPAQSQPVPQPAPVAAPAPVVSGGS